MSFHSDEIDIEHKEGIEPTDRDSAEMNSEMPTEEQDNRAAEMTALDVQSMRKSYTDSLTDLEEEESCFHTWNIINYTKLEQKQYGPEFTMAGYRWRLLLFPFGCQQHECMSIFLDCPGPIGYNEETDDSSKYKHITADFVLIFHNSSDPTVFESKYANHRFTPKQTDWGFTRFYEIRRLGQVVPDKSRPIVEDSSICSISVFVRHIKDPMGNLWHNFDDYDSKKETGYIGIRNQGATCYMNSLIQSLYIISSFRKVVFKIPTVNDQPGASIAYALQRIFYNLEYENEAIGTNELTKSFGWDAMDAFMQHDVQEFNRVLQDSLESRMKKTEVEGALTKIFVGKMKSYIKCLNVNYESSRIEDFWDIQLNVKGMKDLAESFRDYVQVETLTGDNSYFAEGYGHQDAKKGVIFTEFPPILHLQLKRFDFDLEKDAMVKINDRHEFPLEIDLAEFLDKDADRSESWVYSLHGVLVHSGDLHGGHYYALLKPTIDGDWLRFDDDRVTKATLKEVLDENFGGDQQPPGRPQSRQAIAMRRFMNAYMLVYVRKSRREEMLAEVKEADIPEHLRERMNTEKAEERRKAVESSEAYLYVPVRVVTLENFKKHHECDYAFTDTNAADALVSSSPQNNYTSLRIEKNESITDFKKKLSETLQIPVFQFRIWPIITRQNQTLRTDSILDESSDMNLERLRKISNSKNDVLKVWVDVAPNEKAGNHFPKPDDENTHLIFLKHFDVENQVLNGVCTIFINWLDPISSIFEKIRSIMGWSKDTNIKLFEEIKPTLIEEIKSTRDDMRPVTFYSSEIINGDIICFQEDVDQEKASELLAAGKYPYADLYYDFLAHRISVTFKPYSPDYTEIGEKDREWTLILNQKMLFSSLVEIIGQHISIDTNHIRVYVANPNSLGPGQPIKHNSTLTLGSLALPMRGFPFVIYYEILDISVSEMNFQKYIRLSWLSEGISKEETADVWVSKSGSVADAVANLAKKLKKTQIMSSDHYRVYQVSEGRHITSLDLVLPISSVTFSPAHPIYVEAIPEDERNIQWDEKRIVVYHYHHDVKRSHGIPFQFVLKSGERFADTKKRLQVRCGFRDFMFNRISDFTLVRADRRDPIKIEDDMVLFDEVQPDDMIGLNHVEKSRKTSGPMERAISIKSY